MILDVGFSLEELQIEDVKPSEKKVKPKITIFFETETDMMEAEKYAEAMVSKFPMSYFKMKS